MVINVPIIFLDFMATGTGLKQIKSKKVLGMSSLTAMVK